MKENLLTSQDLSAKESKNGNLYVTTYYSHSVSLLHTPTLAVLCIALADNVRKRKVVESSDARWGSEGETGEWIG